YVAGLGIAGHNAGSSLVEISQDRGIQFLCNNEEERYTGIKHFSGYPDLSLKEVQVVLRERGLTLDDVDAWTLSWDYLGISPFGLKHLMNQFPAGLQLLNPKSFPKWNFWSTGRRARTFSKYMSEKFDMKTRPTMLMMPHHENHASFSFAVSPFGRSPDPTLVIVLDGWGDRGSMSVYQANRDGFRQLYSNESLCDSLGCFYSLISSTQGGWTTLSSEGRYMGAVAWGDQDRLTNPYYRRLRQIFYFAEEGKIYINRSMTNWQNTGEVAPYTQALKDIIGEPIAADKMWNPDAVLNVADVQHSPITRQRVDIAAACQLVFEDGIFHIVDHYLRTTGATQLVMTGGTALNCLSNMHLLEKYDESWYEKNLGKTARLNLWVPPVPGDAGVTIGAAYSFAMRCGFSAGHSLDHAFYCGKGVATSEILEAINEDKDIGYEELGNVNLPGDLEAIADLMAYIISQDGVVGVYQGAAETGPRALGHRSILANPCNPETLENINRLVKFREPIRPLAPMVTREQAERFFELSPGAVSDDYNAYNYMVLTAMARPLAYSKVPAIIHKDGTARLQIVRQQTDPLIYAYLKAMGRRVGAEVSVNTSLNVGSPIVQFPVQALAAMKRAKALTTMVMVGETGETYLVWHRDATPPKDSGEQLQKWVAEYRSSQVISA
ncbi:MAG: carbamoyltransferase, partial [Planctomycetota bacterium]|nr:carbamoyltransferase [Planctomycetota bacterium]